MGVESNPPDIPGPLVTLLGDGSGHFSAPIPAPNGNGLSDQNGAGVSVADVNEDGIPDVLSTGIDEAGGSSQIFIGKGDGSFSAGETLYQLGGRLNDFVENGILADVTGDGCPDAVVGDSVTTIHIFPGNCAGQFDKTTSYQIYGMGDPIFGMAVADINGDGKPDLIIGGFPYVPLSGSGPVAGNLLGVRLNDGTGHFGQLKVFAGDPGIYSLVVADLKGTGRPEIITANQNSGSVTVYSNDGSGGFGDPQGGYLGTLDGSGTGPANSGFTDFLLADLDGTGRPDILQIQFPPRFSSNPYQLAVVQNQGGGNFSVPVRTDTFDTNTIIRDFTTGNFRNTGKLDFLAEVTDPANSSVSGFAFAPYLGGGKFGVLSFIPFPALAPDELVSGIAVGDFNHDGKLDFLAIAQDNTQGNSFRMLLYLGNGDGTFRQTLQPLTGPALANPNPPCISRIIRPLPIYVEDANGDGKLDLLLWVNGVYKFLGNGDGTFQSPSYLFPFVPEMAVGDLNHDGLLDFVHLSGCPTESTTLNIFLGEGNGGVSSPALYHPFSGVEAEFNGATSGSSAGYFGQVIGDMNGDGNPDLAVFQILATTLPPYLQFLVGHGDGTFSPTLDIFQLGESGIPLFAVHNLLGDQSTSYLYEDSLGSSYIILPSAPAPAFQLQMDETPVAGSQDGLQITLNVPSSSATSFQITASDPAIQITGSATIPAGQTSVNVPFVILSSFNRLKVFSIAVQTGSESYTSYNYVSPSGANSALELIVEPPANNDGPIPPGASSGGRYVFLAPINGVTANFQIVGCLDLPAAATCTFSTQSLFISPEINTTSTLTVSTTSAIPLGSYPFRIDVTDGTQTLYAASKFAVGDFTLGISPASQSVASNGIANFTYSVGSLANFIGLVGLTCSNLPPSATCGNTGLISPGMSGSLPISLNQSPPGNYTFTVTGTSGADSHAVTAKLQLLAEPVVVLNPQQATLSPTLAGTSSSPYQITLQNSGSGTLSIQNIAAQTTQGTSGKFSQSNNCGASLAAGSSCALQVTFTATTSGLVAGSIQISDNAPDSPQLISLSAVANDFSLSVPSGASSAATVSAGQTANFKLQIQSSQFQGSIVLACSGLPSGANCSFAPAQVEATGSGSFPFQVQVSTGARPSAVHLMRRFLGYRLGIVFFGASMLLLVIMRFLTSHAGRMDRRLVGATALGAALILAACGGGSGSGAGGGGAGGGVPSGTYSVVIAAQGGGGTRTANLQLTIR